MNEANDEIARITGDYERAKTDAEESKTALRESEESLTEREEVLSKREEAVAQEEDAAVSAEKKKEKNSFGSGTHLVGTDIEPGTYRSDGGSACYWERLSGLSGEFDDIIANDFSSGSSVVSITKTDAAFNTQGCGTWTMVE